MEILDEYEDCMKLSDSDEDSANQPLPDHTDCSSSSSEDEDAQQPAQEQRATAGVRQEVWFAETDNLLSGGKDGIKRLHKFTRFVLLCVQLSDRQIPLEDFYTVSEEHMHYTLI